MNKEIILHSAESQNDWEKKVLAYKNRLITENPELQELVERMTIGEFLFFSYTSEEIELLNEGDYSLTDTDFAIKIVDKWYNYSKKDQLLIIHIVVEEKD